MAYAGIDYSLGKSNFDLETGIHFGVISQHSLMPEALDDIYQNGTDLTWEAGVQEFKQSLARVFDATTSLSDFFRSIAMLNAEITASKSSSSAILCPTYTRPIPTTLNSGPTNSLAEYIFDYLSNRGHFDNWEAQYPEYRYESDSYLIETCLQNDLMVLKSNFYTFAQFCSPCVPGAGNLDNEVSEEDGGAKSYCLGPDWFDKDNPMPYKCYQVSDGVEVTA